MKNCIVLSGQYRTFDQTWENIKRFIDINQLDVYCHLWSNSKEEFNNVVDRLKPVRIKAENYELHKEEFEEMEKRIRQANPKNANQDKIAGNASMNYGRKMAFDLVPKSEYDNLIYCRYDIGFRDLFNFKDVNNIVVPLEESYNLISDIFAIMPIRMAKSYFLYDDYERLHSTSWEPEFLNWLRNIKRYPEQDIQTHIHTRYCPHLMLMRNIVMNEHTFIITNLPVYIQR
jgi:hypothetical protein